MNLDDASRATRAAASRGRTVRSTRRSDPRRLGSSQPSGQRQGCRKYSQGTRTGSTGCRNSSIRPKQRRQRPLRPTKRRVSRRQTLVPVQELTQDTCIHAKPGSSFAPELSDHVPAPGTGTPAERRRSENRRSPRQKGQGAMRQSRPPYARSRWVVSVFYRRQGS